MFICSWQCFRVVRLSDFCQCVRSHDMVSKNIWKKTYLQLFGIRSSDYRQRNIIFITHCLVRLWNLCMYVYVYVYVSFSRNIGRVVEGRNYFKAKTRWKWPLFRSDRISLRWCWWRRSWRWWNLPRWTPLLDTSHYLHGLNDFLDFDFSLFEWSVSKEVENLGPLGWNEDFIFSVWYRQFWCAHMHPGVTRSRFLRAIHAREHCSIDLLDSTIETCFFVHGVLPPKNRLAPFAPIFWLDWLLFWRFSSPNSSSQSHQEPPSSLKTTWSIIVTNPNA